MLSGGITMNKLEILAILPYRELVGLVEKAAARYENIHVDCFVGNLRKGLEIAKKQLKKRSYDIILSRGGTAEVLRNELMGMTILEIPISFEDIFYAIMLAKNYQEKFALISYPVLTRQAHSLCELLGYDINIREIHSEEEVYTRLLELRKLGCSMVVGDVITAQIARELDINVVLILSGQNSVNQALDYASWFIPMKQKQYRTSQYYSSMDADSPFMLAIIDSQVNLVFSTFHAKDITNDVFKKYFLTNYVSFQKEYGNQIFRQIGTNLYLLHPEERIIDGEEHMFLYGFVIYEPVALSSDAILLKKDIEDKGYVFKNSYGVVNSIGHAREAIQNCCESPLPVLILGEEGTGKDAAANSIHRRGIYSRNPYFVINCETVSDREWYRFFNKSTSPLLYVNCTIYFKNIHHLAPQHAKNLRKLIEQSNLCQRNKIIFSAVIEADGKKPEFARYILDEVQCLLLQPLPIRKRKEDLKNMLIIYLNEMNVLFGKHIIGLTEEAERIFLDFQWPGNVTQLKRVLRELVMNTEGMYISAEMVEEHIRNEIFDSSETLTFNINLDQTLDGITYDIVNIIMKQENMNQSRTAKRLGVGRTTIWRILKSRQ